MVTESGDLVILAVHREGEDLGPAKTVLAPGDTLLLQGTRDALATNLQVPEVLVVDAPEVVRRQAVPYGPGARRATVIVTSSGAADKLADRLVDIVGDAGPYPLLIGVFILTAVLGQLISNTATALIVIPIAVSAAAALDVSMRPVLMSLAVASAAALLTPVATPANMMIMEPGGYRFGDYTRFGLPLLAWFFVVSVGIVPLIWHL
jgi:Mg2+/citrate symporter